MSTRILAIIFLCTLAIGATTVFFIRRNTTPLFIQPEQPSATLTPAPYPLSPRIVYGYLPYWTRSSARFVPALTHISYFSLAIQADGRILDLPKAQQETGYRAVQNGVLENLREEIRPDQQLELTITMMDQKAIPLFVASESAQRQFLRDLRSVLSTYPVSGINIDVEYNGLVDETLQAQFTNLIKEVSAITRSHTPQLSLSLAAYGDAGSLQRLTQIKDLEPSVDHIIVMAYDYHTRASPRAGPISPLYGKSAGRWEADILSDLHAYTQYVPAHKLILGFPLYGYTWQIENESDPNAFAIPRTGETVTYKYIQEILKRPIKQRGIDPLALTPYVIYESAGDTYVLHYEDAASLRLKIELIHQAGLGGIALWAIGYEGNDDSLWSIISDEL